MKTLNLILPGLIWPNSADYQFLLPQLAIPNLTKLLSRATKKFIPFAVSDFIYANNISGDYDLAKNYAKKLQIIGFQSYLLIEPTHLRIDRDRLLISEAELLQLNDSEVDLLINELNQHFVDDLEIFKIYNELWLVGFKRQLSNDLISYPICDIVGENINDFLPMGSNRLFLHKLMNEMQMLLFNLTLNHQREQEGLLTVNSVWIWNKSLVNLPFNVDVVLSTNPKYGNTFDNFEQIKYSKTSMAFIDSLYYSACYQDHYSWIKQINLLEQQLFTMILNDYNKSQIQEINFYIPTATKCIYFSLNKYNKWKLWRKDIAWAEITCE